MTRGLQCSGGANSVTYSVAQVSKPAVSRVSKSASARTKDGLPTGSRRYSRFGNLRYVIVFAPACTKLRNEKSQRAINGFTAVNPAHRLQQAEVRELMGASVAQSEVARRGAV